MMTLMNLVYALPLVIALVIAGAVVHGRVMGTARTPMLSIWLTTAAGDRPLRRPNFNWAPRTAAPRMFMAETLSSQKA